MGGRGLHTAGEGDEMDQDLKPYANATLNKLRVWVDLCPGDFNLSDLERDMPIKGDENQTVLEKRIDRIFALEKMVGLGELQRVGSRRGWYRPTNLKCERMDFTTVNIKPIDIFWPFGIHQIVNLYPGNVATIGGMKNSGKTAFLLNTALYNRDKWDVHYFNSESGPEELLGRLTKFEHIPLTEWDKVAFYERSSNFAEVIKPGPGALNIIDFLECHEDFFAIGGLIRDIFDALHGGVAIIAIQQNPNTEDPIGGRRSTEKSRLHLKMSPGKLEIKVGKNWSVEGRNPAGLFVEYSLRGGCEFLAKANPKDKADIWQRSDE